MKQQKLFSALISAVMFVSLLSGQTAMQTTAADTVTGDVNSDGAFNISDVVLLQKWLLALPDTNLENWKAADFCEDERLDVFDLCLMKRELFSQNVQPVTDGKLYNRVGVYDQYANIVAFQTLLPEGWTASIESYWMNYSLAYPGVEIVTLTSPDGKAQIRLQSPRNFLQDLIWGKIGQDLEEFATFSNYLDAATYVQYSVQSSYENASLIKDFGQSDDQLIYQKADTEYQAEADYKFQTDAGYLCAIESMEYTNARKQYKSGDTVMELSCAVNGYQYSKAYGTTIAGERRIVWWVPYTVAYVADSQESFDKYYNDYEVIVSNSCFTKQFFQMCSNVGENIRYLMLLGKTESINEWLGTYVDNGNYSSSSVSKQDTIFQMWDDYIKDENAYTLGDGSTIRVPNLIDTIAQNGDSLYFGTSGGIPIGYDVITAN